MRVDLSTDFTSKSCIMTNSSTARTLRVTLLHLIEDQCMMFVVLIESVKQIT